MSPALLAGAVVAAGSLLAGLVLRAGDRRAVVARAASGPPLVPAPGWLAAALADAGVPWPPAVVATGWLGALGSAVLGGLLAGGAGLAVVLVAAVAGGPGVALAAARGRADRALEAALPDLLDAVARSLRSGATLPGALAEASTGGGPAAAEVGRVVADAEGGVAWSAALDGWPTRCPLPGVRLAAAALALAADAGGAAARSVDGVAATLRANLAVAGEVRAQAAQARLSGLVIALAPLAFGALAAGTDRRTAAFLLDTPFGLACLAAGLALDAVAAWWMYRITAAPA